MRTILLTTLFLVMVRGIIGQKEGRQLVDSLLAELVKPKEYKTTCGFTAELSGERDDVQLYAGMRYGIWYEGMRV